MPPLQKIVSSEWLTQAQVKGTAPAKAQIAASLAGRVRYLYELATGEPFFVDGPATPLNPQGALGIDHSGPPWGNAFQHPIWTADGHLGGSADIYGESVVVSVPSSSTVTIIARFVVRPFQFSPLVPYSRARLAAVGRTAGGAAVTTSATFAVYDGVGTNSASRTTTMTSTAGAIAGLAGNAYTNIEWIKRRDPEPTEARWVTLERRIEITETSGNGSIDIIAMSLNQTVRRGH
jgi:hypothetical protein